MSAQHTPGPWVIDPKNPAKVLNGKGGLITHCNSRFWSEVDEPNSDAARANARVIAAAPCMLTALDRAEAFVAGFEDDDTQEGIPELLGAIRAALRKAKGE